MGDVLINGDALTGPIPLDPVVDGIARRPRARGWIHLVSAVVAVFAGVALVRGAWMSPSERAGWAASVYVAGVVAMFTVSATYHRVEWGSPQAEKWMMRLDHSVIFLFIAASYTPLAVLALPPGVGAEVLTMVWAGALAGVALKMCWPSAPRWVGIPLYLMLGYVAIWFADALLHGAGATVVALLIAGGVLYNLGAILYGVQWPNPWPATFGHHEFFHAFTVAAAACHFAAIWLIVH
ncbi:MULTISPECIES: PAQR family membrane homeostasis protein TrhA [Mycolicibacterium]|uniref:PAQR family membrane homeostasis protein TrhA n=1 Tax=Mycolicibacterium TaxID=1866885 RepID=UPI001C3C36D5|nr:hemolysin III family protein [Mycolicibacterium sp. PAM1]